MKYCSKCVTPITRPNITLDADGVCNACHTHELKTNIIDWEQRDRDFQEVVRRAKSVSKGYDCLIPVSGGKDSTWQVVKCLEYRLNPLAVTWKTPRRTELGSQNLANLISLGVDHIDYQVNPKVERKFMFQALERYGSTAIPMHMALFSIPLKLAVRFEIPLVVWGENSAFEYGGTEADRLGFQLNSDWLRKYGVMHGTTAADWVSPEITQKELTPYYGPTEAEMEQTGVLAVFLGYYFPWDVETSLKVALEHGFRVRDKGPLTGYYNYADIDDHFISVHHYLKWYKFGFTRTFDNLSLEIRNGRMTRERAVDILRQRGEEKPVEDICLFCEFVGITETRFYEIIEQFRNPDIWSQRDDGTWIIKDFLVPDWKWV